MELTATQAVYSAIQKHKYIYKFDDRNFYAINEEPPFHDDDEVFTYKLIGREKLSIPIGEWIKVSDIK